MDKLPFAAVERDDRCKEIRYRAERQCCEIRLRAERKAGELLAAMDKAKGGGDQRSEHRSHDTTSGPPTLADLGTT